MAKKISIDLSLEDIQELQESWGGVCLHCGCVELDAQEYYCEDCGATSIMGIESAIMLGYINIIE